MKRRVVLVVFLMLVVMGLSVCAKPLVVATHAVLGELARAVGGDAIEVETIIPSGFCPAHYDLAPSDVVAVQRAALILYSGFEPWMETLRASVGGGALIAISGSWSTPPAAANQLEAVRAALAGLLPDLAGTFSLNAELYRARLVEVQGRLAARAREMRVAGTPVVVMAWQESFVTWLGFSVVETYGMPEGLSLRDLADLAQVGQSAQVKLVVDNLQSGITFGAKLAQAVGAVHVVLSNFPGALPRTATVLDLFEANAEALFSALVPVE